MLFLGNNPREWVLTTSLKCKLSASSPSGLENPIESIGRNQKDGS